jgi:hypothetical protein
MAAAPALEPALCAVVLSAQVGVIAENLLRYGEPEASGWLLSCSDDELVRVCSVADWLLLHGPKEPSGSSMMIAKACALAAVYVREGSPRALARPRRLPAAAVPALVATEDIKRRRPRHDLQTAAPRHYAVGDDARAAWQSRPR